MEPMAKAESPGIGIDVGGTFTDGVLVVGSTVIEKTKARPPATSPRVSSMLSIICCLHLMSTRLMSGWYRSSRPTPRPRSSSVWASTTLRSSDSPSRPARPSPRSPAGRMTSGMPSVGRTTSDHTEAVGGEVLHRHRLVDFIPSSQVPLQGIDRRQ